MQPQPLSPLTFATSTFFLAQFGLNQSSQVELEVGLQPWLASAPQSLVYGTVIGGFFWALSKLLSILRQGTTQLVAYHLGILTVAILFAGLLWLQHSRSFEAVAFGVLRIYLAILIVAGMIGLAQRKLLESVTRAERALAEAERQRSLLLIADETTRREVAAFLHNRVQAGLVVTAMQLKMTAVKIGGPEETELNSLIQELEDIRKFDVRAAGQQLSPDFELIDLEEALQDLIRGYKKTMAVHTVIDSDVTGLSAEMTLGIYRICEQAMLNAAVHGAATQCTIHIARDGAGAQKIALTIENNGTWEASQGKVSGAGLVSAGAGSAVIEAWVKKFKGEWSLTGGANSAVTLKAVLFCELAG